MAEVKTRPTWDEYFMRIAAATAARSSCDRAAVGAVIVQRKRIMATGYNGAPAGTPNCFEAGHKMVNGHCVRAVHAEQNAIVQAAHEGIALEGATIYTTHRPCLNCSKAIIQAGIQEIVYGDDYRSHDEESEFAAELLEAAGVKVRRMDYAPR